MKNNILKTAFSFALIGICFLAAGIVLKNQNGQDKYDVVVFGDSIMAGDHSFWTVPSVMNDTSDYSVLNGAFGGMNMSLVRLKDYNGDISDVFTMIRLSEALKTHDFSLQVMSSKKDVTGATAYAYDTAVALSNTDWDAVRYIIVEHGINDYLNQKPVDNALEPYDIDTFGGALRCVIENITEGVPNARLILCTPIYAYPIGLSEATTTDYGQGVLTDYIAKEKEIASEYGIYVIDNFNEININKDNYLEYLPDGLHGGFEGNEIIAENILKHLKELDGNS